MLAMSCSWEREYPEENSTMLIENGTGTLILGYEVGDKAASLHEAELIPS